MKGLKVVTIGGGSSYTPELVEGFIKRYDVLPIRELWLVDIEEGREKLEIVGALAKRMVQKANVPIEIHLSYDRKKALEGADFVTTQIRVGLLAARAIDEKIPLDHGMLGQETNGAGGMFKAFRTIPVILEITKEMKELCPDAWLINFSNPAGIVTEAILRHGAIKKTVGLCNVPIHMEKRMATLFEADSSRFWMKFAGLNHMVYAINAYLDGVDVMKQIPTKMEEMKDSEAMKIQNVAAVDYEPEFLRALGVLPCYYHTYYYRQDEQLAKILKQHKEGTTRALEVKKIEDELFELYKDENLQIKPPQLEKRGGAYYSDAACNLIESIYNDKRDIQTVNTINNGAIYGIEHESAIEVSSVITKSGPMPLNIGKLPVQVHGLVIQMKSFERMVVEASVEGDIEKAILALSINPLTPSDKLAKEVTMKLLDAHKKYLPQFFK
ncbi:MAG: 6-phospho-beta-glucosidase [Defluviitaleaceae bacterium]|nr:6-phospho-beta-glucosidase [Defluviitaleaceae bacterium]